VATERPMDLHI